MDISFVNKTSNSGANASSLTVNVPAGIAVGDVLLWVIARLENVSAIAALPTGWLWVTDGPSEQIGDSYPLSVDLFYRIVDGTEPASYTYTLGVTSAVIIGEMSAYTGVHPTAPIYSQQGLFPDFFTPSSATFVFDQIGFDEGFGANLSYQVVYIAHPISITYSAPGGYTAQYYLNGAGGGQHLSLGVFDAPGYDTGLGNSLTITGSVSHTRYGGLRIFLRPAAVPEPTLTWTVFAQFQVPPATNWPSLLKDSDNTALYALYTTNPTGGTILEKYNLITRTLITSFVFDAGVPPATDNCIAQDATHLYIALNDGKIRKVRKSDLVQIGASIAPFDCGVIMCPTYNGSILWTTEDCGEFLYKVDPTTLAFTTFDTFGTGVTILAMTSDDLGNAWALGYGGGDTTHILKITPSFVITDFDVSADLPIGSNTESQNSTEIGFDATTGYLWASVFQSEDQFGYSPVGGLGMLVWDSVTHATINTFRYGKPVGVAHASLINGLGVWDSTTRSRWVSFNFLGSGEHLAFFGTPAIADLVRFDDQGVFIEKVPIDNPPMDSPILLQELQSAVISIQPTSQDVWMVLHGDLPDGTCIKQIAVISEPLAPPPDVSFRTTQIVVEVVVRPHPPQAPIVPPPPLVFIGPVLHSATGSGLPMEVCGGYIGKPPIHSQLSEVRAHYTDHLAPLSSELIPFHTEQIGEKDVAGRHGVINPKNSWFHFRQTDRYHRVCLFCRGETEVTGLTYQLREAGNR